MKIIKISKKDDITVVVHFDNDEKLFLSYEVLLKNGLKKNDEISESRFSLLINENQLFHIKQRAFRYLARRRHSSFELKNKLRQKKYDLSLISIVIEELQSKKLLDDHDFATAFTDEYSRNKLWGKNKLKAELMKRGIHSAIIGDVLNEKFPDGNDINNALALAEKKAKQLSSRNLDEKKLKEKIMTFLFSKGYDYDTSRQAVNEVFKSDKN